MTPDSHKITTLPEDMLRISSNHGGRKLELNRLCRDCRDPFLLSDKKPVLNITQDDLVGIFADNSRHYYLSPEQALRFGVFCGLDLPRVIALMIKAEWEGLIPAIAGYSVKPHHESASFLKDQNTINKYIHEFKPDTGKFYTLIRDIFHNSDQETTYGLIDFLISDLLEEGKFLADNDEAGTLYSDIKLSELKMLAEATDLQSTEYKELKIRWIEKNSELDDYLLILEEKKRSSLNSADRYYQTFNKQESEKAALVFRIEKLRIVLSIMNEQSGLSYRMLIEMAEERLEKTERNRNEIKQRIMRSQNYIDFRSFGIKDSYMTEELKNKYIKEVKTLLRKIWFLCHPDTSPNYNKLSDESRKEVDDLWLRIMKSAKEEQFSYSPHMLLYHVPDIKLLKDAYFRLCSLLDVEPELYEVGNRLEFMIRTGVPISGISEFLKNDIAKICLQLTNLELVQDKYTDEPAALRYRAALENISKHSDKLKKEINDLRKTLVSLKNDIIDQFKKAEDGK